MGNFDRLANATGCPTGPVFDNLTEIGTIIRNKPPVLYNWLDFEKKHQSIQEYKVVSESKSIRHSA